MIVHVEKSYSNCMMRTEIHWKLFTAFYPDFPDQLDYHTRYRAKVCGVPAGKETLSFTPKIRPVIFIFNVWFPKRSRVVSPTLFSSRNRNQLDTVERFNVKPWGWTTQMWSSLICTPYGEFDRYIGIPLKQLDWVFEVQRVELKASNSAYCELSVLARSCRFFRNLLNCLGFFHLASGDFEIISGTIGITAAERIADVSRLITCTCRSV